MITGIQYSQKTEQQIFKKSQESLSALLQRKDLGFFQIQNRSHLWATSFEMGREIRAKFNDLVVVGIGGSSLGSRVLSEAFTIPRGQHQLHVLENLDSLEFKKLMASFGDLEKVAWLFISKSGSTLETLVCLDFIHEVCKERGSRFFPNTYFITENKSNPLFDLAQKHQRPVLEVPFDVGGRFSVLTPVGMVPAAFLGQDPAHFKEGMEQALKKSDLAVEMIAQSIQSFQRQEWITLLWSYSSSLRAFGGWFQQLWAESLGKKVSRLGAAALRASTPMSAVGACDQHSILQQVMEGEKDKFVIFVTLDSLVSEPFQLKETQFSSQKYCLGKTMGQILEAEALATRQALSENGVSTARLQVSDLSAQSLGELFMFWELVVGGIGEYHNINAFDQPGVELGKRLAMGMLQS